MKTIKTIILILPVLFFALTTSAANIKKVFAQNNILFINSPEKGVLPKINAYSYIYDSEKTWLDNNALFYPLVSDLAKQMSLKEAVDFEIQSAMKMGIDGFSFIYVISKNNNLYKRYNEIIEAYFEVAEEKGYPFYFNIALKFEPNNNLDEAIADASGVLKHFTNNKYSFSKNWHIENDKKVIMLSKVKSLLTKEERKKMEKSDDMIFDISLLFNRIDAILQPTIEDYNCIYTCIWPGRKKEVIEASKKFYTVKMEAFHMREEKLIERFNNNLKLTNKPFVHSIYHDHVSSYYVEIDSKKKKPRAFVIKEDLKINECYKEYDDLSLSKGLRLGFEQANNFNASILILNSWNTYIEGSQFRQEYNHGFGLGPLLNTLVEIWKNEEVDQGVFVAYRNKQKVDSNFLDYKVRKSIGDTQYSQDSIEVITYTKKPSKVIIEGTGKLAIGSGLQITTIPWKKGNLNISLVTEGVEIANLTTTREIREVDNRNQPNVIYQSSFDKRIIKDLVNTLATQEVNYFNIRFMLDPVEKNQWLKIEEERMHSHLTNLILNETNNKAYRSNESKNNERYEKKVKKLLPEFHYEVWKELKEEKLLEVSSSINNYDLYNLHNTYNVLEID
ncbi:hypothetical protein [Flammeovirga kamogawensis]|uniref:Uncharacterized protein n=1 Tax=Flammeovirga kamogawensis TaxID=373891 RepID=A0ABX8H2U9_9BACT|nr:hypothetical protein [Flammeovirga kamogawensis]MBB6460441.1 hypothetical protein [Flammeovirga kamogawensis]QWG10246.1 hypothetical protein KM029_21425 [Flammeovirga kamogawensis]TRX64695.1 hypothetical protein EO216_19350 [Flammeovirga kamogawensis]